MPKPKSDLALKPDDILTAEYEYIARTVFQANEDRSRVASFYFVSVGSIVAAILGTQFATDKSFSIANLIAVEAALLDGLTSAAAFYFALFAIGEILLWGWALIILSFIMGALLQWFWYKHLLVDDR